MLQELGPLHLRQMTVEPAPRTMRGPAHLRQITVDPASRAMQVARVKKGGMKALLAAQQAQQLPTLAGYSLTGGTKRLTIIGQSPPRKP
jgi:hypothetical protein